MVLFRILLAFHILGGSIALLSGLVPMLARKGGPAHRNAGRVFCIALGVAAASAFALSLIVHSKLLLTIAVLTGFLIFSGLRAAWLRRRARAAWPDHAACLLLVAFGGWLLWHSIAPVDITGLFFGIGSLLLAARQWQLLRSARPDWLLAHIAGMGGAYIATVTAFLVVNIDFLPKPVTFIVPPLIGTALISLASARYGSRAKPIL